MIAPATTAPLGSVTVPTSVAAEVCATARALKMTRQAKQRTMPFSPRCEFISSTPDCADMLLPVWKPPFAKSSRYLFPLAIGNTDHRDRSTDLTRRSHASSRAGPVMILPPRTYRGSSMRVVHTPAENAASRYIHFLHARDCSEPGLEERARVSRRSLRP